MQNKGLNEFEASRDKLDKCISKRSHHATSGDSGGTNEQIIITEKEVSIKSYF